MYTLLLSSWIDETIPPPPPLPLPLHSLSTLHHVLQEELARLVGGPHEWSGRDVFEAHQQPLSLVPLEQLGSHILHYRQMVLCGSHVLAYEGVV